MARIEWVKLRLNNWALWRLRDIGGGLGFSTQSVLLGTPVDRYREVNINETIDSNDASLTNTAVESLKPGHLQVYETLQCYYITGHGGIRDTARRLGKAESTISANLDQADKALRQWFDERTDKKKKSFTT